MANVLTPVDVYALVNSAVKEMYGANSTLTAFDTSSFVSIGEQMLRTGYENTLNALNLVFARTIFAIKPYQASFEIIAKTPEQFGGRSRKISFYATEAEQSENFNTADHQPLSDGQSIDHYVIKKTYPMELDFVGQKIITRHYTTFRNQLKVAFQSEAEFSAFYGAMMTNIANDIQMQYEAQNRLMVLNLIGATKNTGAARSKVDLTSAFNTKYGTSYTAAQLKTTYLKEFVGFLTAHLKNDMDLMARNNTLFHIYPAKQDDDGNDLVLLRHTPKSDVRMLLYKPLVRDAEAQVYPELFNPQYLDFGQYEGVMYWQNPTEGKEMSVKVTPNQLNPANGQSATGNAVTIDNMVAMLYDVDAMQTAIKLEEVITTPVNASGDYYNTYYHWSFNFLEDQTENVIIYYM